VRIGIRLPPCDRLDRLAEQALLAEQLGFDSIWCPDSQLLWREPFAALSVAALKTSTIGLGVGVTNAVTRHPSLVAASARTVSELAPNRFVLGIGSGDSSVLPVGLRRPSLATLRERIQVIRRLLNGYPCEFEGNVVQLHGQPSPCPIYMAASGPRALELAGEVGDGVILLSGVSEQHLRAALTRVRGGRERAGRQTGEFDVVAATDCRVTDDVERDARELKPICLGIWQNGGASSLGMAGIELGSPPRLDVYPDLIHAEDWEAAVTASSKWVSDEDAVKFAEAFCLYGSPEAIARKVRAAGEAGARAVFLQHAGSYTFPTQMMRDFAAGVLPRLAYTVR
jgi:5,10-methylenetetrahydromethanopterin reductase